MPTNSTLNSLRSTISKRWVWVPDEKEGYFAAWVVREHDKIGDVMLAGGGEVRLFQHGPRVLFHLLIDASQTRSVTPSSNNIATSEKTRTLLTYSQ